MIKRPDFYSQSVTFTGYQTELDSHLTGLVSLSITLAPMKRFAFLHFLFFLLASEALAQSTTIISQVIDGQTRRLRTGTFSKRTVNGLNDCVEPKTWTFRDETSWDSKYYGGKTFNVGAMNSGSNVLTCSGANFATADIGKTIEVTGAGAGGALLTTTIVTRNSSTQVTLATTASTTVSNTKIYYYDITKPGYTEAHYALNASNNFSMNYRLLFPKAYNQSESYEYPMIVMLHGLGEGSTCWGGCGSQTNAQGDCPATFTNVRFRNNDLNLVHGGLPHMEAIHNPTTGSNGKKPEDPTLHSRAFPGFVLFPQSNGTTSGWNSAEVERVYRIIQLLTIQYKIDPDRIYLHGLSNGGAGVWEILKLKPEIFAAVLPMSASIPHGSAIFNAEVAKTVPVPAWLFQGANDGNPSVANTNQIVAKLKAAGGTPRYKIYPNAGHGIWGNAYNEPDFFTWMLRQNKANVQVLFGDSTICGTNGAGVQMALSAGFLAYQWEKDGVAIPGATGPNYTATVPGTYRARFSRVSASPSEAQWNQWSKPVVVREKTPVTPVLTTTSSPHFPDINSSTSVRIDGPTTGGLTKNWYKNGVLTTAPPVDTASFLTKSNISGHVGVYHLITKAADGCPSLPSNEVHVTISTPVGITAPSNLQGEVTTPGSIQLFWQDNSNNETGFELQRGTTNGGPYAFYKLLDEDAIAFEDTGLTPNTTYYYRLRATNTTQRSDYTTQLAVTISTDTEPPTPPQNLVVSTNTVNSVTLSWSPSTDNGGVQAYYVYNGTTPIATGSNNTSYTVTGLAPNSNFAFTVRAVDFNGNYSEPSSQLMATTVVTGLTYSHTLAVLDNFTLVGTDPVWQAPWTTIEKTGKIPNFSRSERQQDDYYWFKYDGYISVPSSGNYRFRITSDDGSAMYLGTQGVTTAFVATSGYPGTNGVPLAPNTTRIISNDHLGSIVQSTSSNQSLSVGQFYPITVIYFEKVEGDSLWVEYAGPPTGGTSNWQPIPNSLLKSGTAPTLVAPNQPLFFEATVSTFPEGMTSIFLSWAHGNSTDDFEIFRSTDNETYQIIHREETLTQYTDTGLIPNTTYYYKIRAVNANGVSTFLGPEEATTLPDTQAPTVPLNLSVISNTYTNAGLNWDAATDNVGVAHYNVYSNGNLLGTATNTAFYTTALLPATLYDFTVKAVDFNGNESAASNTATITTTEPEMFYSVAGQNLTSLTSWKENPDGSGNSPTSFNFNGQQYVIQASESLTSTWQIGGEVSKVIVGDGVTLNLNSQLQGKISATGSSVVNVNYDGQASGFNFTFDELAPTSTVNFNTYSTIPAANFGNVNLNGSGVKNLPPGVVEVTGNLQLGNNVELKSTSSNGSTVRVGGNVDLGTLSASGIASDNWPSLQFSANANHSLVSGSNPNFYQLVAEAGATINYSSPSATTIRVGSLNGGGLELENGSTLSIGNNTLALTGQASINPTNTTGRLSVDNGSIQFTSTSSALSNVYFDPAHNDIQNLTIQNSGGGVTAIREPIEVYDGVKINQGVLNSSGNIAIKSSATASASIRQIQNGSITGEVTVERFMAPKGRLYRYLSTPQSNVTVADWQNYIPITGDFDGASTGPGLTANASMFYYAEPSYSAYPPTASTNQVPIEVGRGYAVFIREGVDPTTLTTAGLPNQGNVSFTSLLTGGTGSPTDGWNLLGNPYASDIVWSNTGWTSSGIGNVISVRENLPGGAFQFRYWDRSGAGSGTLENGKIPAGQAFWVQATNASPTLTISEAAKTIETATQNTEFYRIASADLNTVETFAIALTNGTYEDKAFVTLKSEGSDLYTKLTDGEKRPNSFFNLSTLSSDQVALAVNELSGLFCDKTIPVKLENIAVGTYTLKFETDQFKTASLTLVDSYLNQSTLITDAQPEISFSVTSEASSYQNRFAVVMKRTDINTAVAVSAPQANLCSSIEYATVEIENSQPGLEYEVVNAALDALSEKVLGTGEKIELFVPVSALASGQNQLKVRGGFQGCASKELDKSVVVSISEIPQIDGQHDLEGCVGTSFEVKVNSNSSTTFKWFDLLAQQSLSETSSRLQIASLGDFHSLLVTAVNEQGCESEPFGISILADTLDAAEVITLDHETLETNITTNIQWLLNGEIIEGATEQQLNPTESGSYAVQTSMGHCTRISEPVEFIVTGIEGTSAQLMLQVYPNPSSPGQASFRGVSPYDSPLQINVTDVSGKVVVNRSITYANYTEGVELREVLSPGLYVLRVAQHGVVVHRKLVVR